MATDKIQGLDCAQCASEIECAEQESDGMETARLSFATDKWPMIRIITAAALLLVGLVFNSALHDTPWAIGEYSILLLAYALVGASVLYTAFRSIMRGQVFNEMFLMSVATTMRKSWGVMRCVSRRSAARSP